MGEEGATSDFGRRLVRVEGTPPWLAAMRRFAGASGGGIAMLVCDDDQGRLRAVIVTGGGAAYGVRLSSIEADPSFWRFAAAYYFWITPTVVLRKKLSQAILGAEDGIKGSALGKARNVASMSFGDALKAMSGSETNGELF